MIETLRDLVVSLSLQTDNFTRNMQSVNKQIKEAESSFKLASAGVDKFDQDAVALGSQLGALQEKLSLQKTAVDQYSKALEAARNKLQECYTRQTDYAQRLEEAMQRHEQLGEQVQRATAKYEEYKATLGESDSATIAAKQNLDALKEEYKASGDEVKKLSGQNEALKKATQNAADAVTTASTKLNAAKGAVKETEAAIEKCNASLSLSQTNWYSAGEAMGDEGVIAHYGGELQRDWFDVFLVERVGHDTNVQIRQGKNLLGISYDVDVSDVITRIMPTGQDKDGEVLYLPELFLDSENIQAYPHPKWIHLAVSDAKESDDKDEPKTKEQCYTEMREAVQAQFDAGCDLPKVTLTVSFINCPDTEEYKPYGFLQTIFLGDAVRVLAPRIGVMVSMRMTQYTYDCLLKKYTSMTLGTVADTVESNVISARKLPSGIITGSKLAINSVGTGQLQSGSVSSAQIQMAAIETAHIQDAAITRAKVGEAAIGEAQIADAAIGMAKIQDAAVGRAKIADGAIGTAQIGDAAITRAKIGDAAIGSAQIDEGAIGSAHIGQGVIEEAHIQDAAITSAKIGEGEIKQAHIEDGAIGTAKIEDAAITNAKIGGAAVGTANIQDAAIVAAKILDGEIITAKIADLAVTGAKIADLAVTTAKIAQAAITNAQIANAAVDTAQIALGAITAALIANGAVGTAQIADASITDAKVVSLNADVITSGTLATERLIIRGDDGLIYEINAQASGLSVQELQQEKYRQQLSGTVLVARSVTAEQIAAATITANEILSGTITGDKIAAATIEGSNIKAGAITTSHVSSDFGQTLDLSSNTGINQRVERVYSDMDELVGFRIEIISSSDILSEDIQQTTLTARVWHGSQNVTESLPASRFQWKRKSADSTADALWNVSHTGMKSILLTTRDVLYSATYDCELLKE